MGCSMKTTTLGNLCHFKAGSAFPKEFQGRSGLDYMFIKVSDFNLSRNRWKISVSNNTVDDAMLSFLKARVMPPGSTVFAKIGEALKANRTRLLVADTAIDNNMMAAIPKNSTDPLYLYYLLSCMHLSTWAEGSALPYLKQSVLEQIAVTVPQSLDVQRQIAMVLYRIDELIESLRKANDYLAA